jgi:TRAP-type mannitol/chloroaromatic compound transport system substrate-binding protein
MFNNKMNFKKMIGVSSFALLLSLSSFANAGEVFKYKFQSSDNSGSENYKAQQAWAKNVKTLSNGELLITMMPVNSVVKHTETLDAISTGVLDGHITALGYFSGKDPAFGLLGNTVGAWGDPNELLLFMEHGGGNKLVTDLLAPYGITNLGSSTTGLEAFVSKIPLDGVSDLKGLKLRAPEGLVQSVFAAAGASPVNLPGSEVFTSLDKGVIQAADYTVFSTNNQQGLHKVATHPVYPGFHSLPLINVSLNTDAYNKLPSNLQAILKTSVVAFSRNIVSILKLKDLEVLGKVKQDPSITIHDWSSVERNKFRSIAQGEWKKFAKKSPNAQKVFEVLSSYLSNNGML